MEKDSKNLEQHLGNLESDKSGGVAPYVLVGGALIGATFGALAAGAYIGSALGWLVGNLLNVLPVVNNAIPDMARSYGLEPKSDINVRTCQTLGTLAGLGFGWLPWKIYFKKDD